MIPHLPKIALALATLAVALAARPRVEPAQAHGGPLLSQDFNGPEAWPDAAASGAGAAVSRAPAGSYDEAGGIVRSGALVLTAQGAGDATLTSGLLPVQNPETDLGKLTLSFDESVSSVRPVWVQIESVDARKRRTGGREGVVYPAAPDFTLRAALELASMKSFGGGAFRPTDPFVRITFHVAVPIGAPPSELRIDNVAYSRPAFYVNPRGSDANDGRTEATAFANPQKAVDVAQPGDIVLLMDGTYRRPSTSSTQAGVVDFRRAGTPAAWIVVKNYPGAHPILTSDAWNTVRIGRGSSEGGGTTLPALAYLEVRGLHVVGNAKVAKERFPDDIGKSLPDSNGNGMTVDSRYEKNVSHHIRFADNVVEQCCGGGIVTLEADWIVAEHNVCRDNCWWTIYAPSGISFLGVANFDGSDNVYKDLVRDNVCSGNRCFVPWSAVKRISDGNGIILDTDWDVKKGLAHRGRTLVQSNLSFGNGGSGIHAYRCHRVDIVNNTAYLNGASPELNWGQIFVQACDDMRVVNNVLVSRKDQPVNSVGRDGGDQNSTNVVRAFNVYFGGLAPKLTGEGDLFADPRFVNPSTDAAVADFHLREGSPAIRSGAQAASTPLRDLDGKPRGAKPSRGAYER